MNELMSTAYNFYVYHNQQEFIRDKFNEGEDIKKFSYLTSTYSITHYPGWTDSRVELNELTDEVAYFQLGQQRSAKFTTLGFFATASTSFNVWPTKQDPKTYKFNSYWFELGQTKKITERTTYSMLQWIGDVGGLFDGLKLTAQFIIGPIAAFTLNSQLLS